MKVFISADIEGVTGVTDWTETELGHGEFEAARQQMSRFADGVYLITLPEPVSAEQLALKAQRDLERIKAAVSRPRIACPGDWCGACKQAPYCEAWLARARRAVSSTYSRCTSGSE